MKIQRTPLTIAQKKYADNLKKIWNKKKQEWRQKGKKLTQERAAEQLGFETQGAISQYLNGKVALNDSTILKFSKFLGCNPGQIKPELDSFINKDIKGKITIKEMSTDDLKTQSIVEWDNAEYLPNGAYAIVPRVVISLSKENGEIVINNNKAGSFAFKSDWLKKKGFKKSNLVCIEFSGDSMRETIKDGALLLINKGEIEINDGKIYCIKYKKELKIKRLYNRFDGGIIMKSDNTIFPEEIATDTEFRENIDVIGQVVWQAGEI